MADIRHPPAAEPLVRVIVVQIRHPLSGVAAEFADVVADGAAGHQGQVQGGLLQTGYGGTLGGGMDHGEALRLKQAGEMPGKGLLILHQKNSFHGEAPSFLDR